MPDGENEQAVVLFDTTINQRSWRVRAKVTLAQASPETDVHIDWLRPVGDDSEELTERQAVDRFGAEVVNGILELAARAARADRIR